MAALAAGLFIAHAEPGGKTEALAGQKKWQTAAEGLLTTVNRFPTEGRYVPKMTLKMQDVCANYKGGNDRLATETARFRISKRSGEYWVHMEPLAQRAEEGVPPWFAQPSWRGSNRSRLIAKGMRLAIRW